MKVPVGGFRQLMWTPLQMKKLYVSQDHALGREVHSSLSLQARQIRLGRARQNLHSVHKQSSWLMNLSRI